jgi:hypothetical protein
VRIARRGDGKHSHACGLGLHDRAPTVRGRCRRPESQGNGPRSAGWQPPERLGPQTFRGQRIASQAPTRGQLESPAAACMRRPQAASLFSSTTPGAALGCIEGPPPPPPRPGQRRALYNAPAHRLCRELLQLVADLQRLLPRLGARGGRVSAVLRVCSDEGSGVQTTGARRDAMLRENWHWRAPATTKPR